MTTDQVWIEKLTLKWYEETCELVSPSGSRLLWRNFGGTAQKGKKLHRRHRESFFSVSLPTFTSLLGPARLIINPTGTLIIHSNTVQLTYKVHRSKATTAMWSFLWWYQLKQMYKTGQNRWPYKWDALYNNAALSLSCTVAPPPGLLNNFTEDGIFYDIDNVRRGILPQVSFNL